MNFSSALRGLVADSAVYADRLGGWEEDVGWGHGIAKLIVSPLPSSLPLFCTE